MSWKTETEELTASDINQLEYLLAKVRSEIGSFCIIPGYIQDGHHMATYDKYGKLNRQVTEVDLYSCIKKLKDE